MRLLHLLDLTSLPHAPGHASDGAVLLCRSVIDETPEVRHEICLLGGTAAERRAAFLGIVTTDRIAPPLGQPALANRGLAALIRDRGTPDLICCWNDRVLRLAEGISRTALRVWINCSRPTGAGVFRPRFDIAPSIDDGATTIQPPAIVGPPGASREALRRAMDIPQRSRVLMLVADPPSAGDALAFASMLSLLSSSGSSVCGLIRAGSANEERARRSQRVVQDGTLVVSDRPIHELVRCADVGVACPSQPMGRAPATGIATAIAHANGLPVVASVRHAADVYDPKVAMAACLSRSANRPELARKVIELFEGDDLRREVSDAVRRRTSDHSLGMSLLALARSHERIERSRAARATMAT